MDAPSAHLLHLVAEKAPNLRHVALYDVQPLAIRSIPVFRSLLFAYESESEEGCASHFGCGTEVEKLVERYQSDGGHIDVFQKPPFLDEDGHPASPNFPNLPGQAALEQGLSDANNGNGLSEN